MGAQGAGRWDFLRAPRARGMGSGHLNLGARRGPPQRQLPDRRCTPLDSSPGRKVTPASRTWGLGLSCGCSRPSPTSSSPGWTEGQASLVLSLSPPQLPIPGDQRLPRIRCWVLPVPKSPAPTGPPPGYPGLTQNCLHRRIQPRTLATLGGRTWPRQHSLSARGSLTAADRQPGDCGHEGPPQLAEAWPSGPAQPAPDSSCHSGLGAPTWEWGGTSQELRASTSLAGLQEPGRDGERARVDPEGPAHPLPGTPGPSCRWPLSPRALAGHAPFPTSTQFSCEGRPWGLSRMALGRHGWMPGGSLHPTLRIAKSGPPSLLSPGPPKTGASG